MSDIVPTSSIASSALVRAVAIETDLDGRLQATLPEVVDPDGRIDWRKLGSLHIGREVGSVVMAYAMPEFLTDTSQRVSELEAMGLIDEALEAYEQAEKTLKAASHVLQTASGMIYEPTPLARRYRTRDGEMINQGAALSQLADVLVVRMQADAVTTEAADAFIESTVRPTIELVHQGFEADTALAIIDMATDLEYAPDEIVDAAAEYNFDLRDETDRGRFSYLIKKAGGIETLGDYRDAQGNFEIDESEIETEEAITSPILSDEDTEGGEEDDDDDEEDEDAIDESPGKDKLAKVLAEMGDIDPNESLSEA